MAATAGPKPIGPRLEPCLPLGLQRVDDPCLVARGRRSRESRAVAACCCPGLGMYTRLTGMALNGSALCCTLSASCILASGVSTTSPSTPAVRRPALRSVTRRTLTSVFARERSINFCNRRTLARSPAFDAVKIRCRNRRTSSSTRRQSIWRQSKGASSGPFTTTVRRGVQLVLGFRGHRSSFSSQAHLTASAPLSRPGTRPGIRPVIRDDQPGGAGHRVPVSRCLSAAGIRFSVIRFPPGSWAFLTVGLPAQTARTPTGLPRSARTSYDRGGCPLYPGDGGAHPD